MDSEFVFRSRLRSAITEYVSTHETPFTGPTDESTMEGDSDHLFISSSRRDGVVLETVPPDVDPHSDEVIRRGLRRARGNGVRVFATANRNDAFLFRGPKSATGTDVSSFARRQYDLRSMSLTAFCERFLSDVTAFQDGAEPPVRFDDFVVGRLRSFHASLVPRYESLIADAFEEDDDFHDSMTTWAAGNDYPIDSDFERTCRIAAQQYAYRLVIRIVLDALAPGRDGESEGGFSADEWTNPNETGFWSDVPNDEGTLKRLRGFADSIEREPLSDIDTDIFGRIYQKLIPVERRTELGQFYTPNEIGRLLARWAIRSPDDRVLDPASGSGSLLVEAYKRLDELGSSSHPELLRRITAVDIDEFPLQLTRLNLAVRSVHEPTDERFVHHGDFFDLDPATVGTFDATVANPPYVRQETLAANREHFREHLDAFDSAAEIDGRSDLYCYFLTHVTSFLRDGARLAWVVPTKWMAADYGRSLQRFLHAHYGIRAVVGFRNRLFEDALVDTVLLLLERTDDAAARRRTETNFVRINERMEPADVLAAIDRSDDIPNGSYLQIRGRRAYRTVTVRQSHLADTVEEKIHHYITAPALYTAVLEHGDTIPLSDIATVTRGKKTGANPIFVLDSDGKWARTVEERFLRPAVKGVREVDGYEHTAADAGKRMLDMAAYVESVLSEATTDPDEANTCERCERVESALERDGYDGVLSYLRWAESQPSRANASVRANDPWFDMGPLDDKTAPVVCPQAMDTRRFFFRTDGELVVSNRFLVVSPRDVDATLLLGLLNASLTKIAVESHGRVTGGGAVNLSGSDLRTLQVVNPDALTDEQKATVRDGFERLVGGEEGGQTAIDGVVRDVLGLDVSVEELRNIARTMKVARRTKADEPIR